MSDSPEADDINSAYKKYEKELREQGIEKLLYFFKYPSTVLGGDVPQGEVARELVPDFEYKREDYDRHRLPPIPSEDTYSLVQRVESFPLWRRKRTVEQRRDAQFKEARKRLESKEFKFVLVTDELRSYYGNSLMRLLWVVIRHKFYELCGVWVHGKAKVEQTRKSKTEPQVAVGYERVDQGLRQG